ncbi:hypothetical protein PF327_09935 [Sulfurovum sp. XTW-4]|uniref:Uncharacterized protein n=1 Tax=Sulfurovum xiamenensis TaxID=3019066 RepID=A0ABT7QU20_9BACT|nr:hypothetical protein [Sulfurovum xiamenensis]MDM5264515.1 hypothetical protein [Sulfurovum xiamenensis]
MKQQTLAKLYYLKKQGKNIYLSILTENLRRIFAYSSENFKDYDVLFESTAKPKGELLIKQKIITDLHKNHIIANTKSFKAENIFTFNKNVLKLTTPLNKEFVCMSL